MQVVRGDRYFSVTLERCAPPPNDRIAGAYETTMVLTAQVNLHSPSKFSYTAQVNLVGAY
jgi:hypothetical protein